MRFVRVCVLACVAVPSLPLAAAQARPRAPPRWLPNATSPWPAMRPSAAVQVRLRANALTHGTRAVRGCSEALAYAPAAAPAERDVPQRASERLSGRHRAGAGGEGCANPVGLSRRPCDFVDQAHTHSRQRPPQPACHRRSRGHARQSVLRLCAAARLAGRLFDRLWPRPARSYLARGKWPRGGIALLARRRQRPSASPLCETVISVSYDDDDRRAFRKLRRTRSRKCTTVVRHRQSNVPRDGSLGEVERLGVHFNVNWN